MGEAWAGQVKATEFSDSSLKAFESKFDDNFGLVVPMGSIK